jgi:hypothetical protein
MPVHVDEMTTEVDAFQGDMPLSREQLEKLVSIVLTRIEERQRERELLRESTQIRPSAIRR